MVLYRDHICPIPCCWWSYYVRSSMGISAWLIWVFSSGLDVGVFLRHSPSLSRLSPSVSSQSSVKVDVITPLLCRRNVSSSVVSSLFLDAWHSNRKVRWSNHSSGSSSKHFQVPNLVNYQSQTLHYQQLVDKQFVDNPTLLVDNLTRKDFIEERRWITTFLKTGSAR